MRRCINVFLSAVTELAANGSVEDVLKDKSIKISFHRKMKIARETAAGMNWLHCMKPSPLLHLDLKTANLLVSRVNTSRSHVPLSNDNAVNSWRATSKSKLPILVCRAWKTTKWAKKTRWTLVARLCTCRLRCSNSSPKPPKSATFTLLALVSRSFSYWKTDARFGISWRTIVVSTPLR